MTDHRTLTITNISKSYGAVQALSGVDLEVAGGRITALLGENGAGKSTLVKALTGVIQPDGGQIRIDGKEVSLPSPRVARDAGIAATFQEPAVFPDLSIAENIFAGRQSRGRPFVRHSSFNGASVRILRRLQLEYGPTTPVRELTIADRQLIEIAKGLSIDASFLILDEPTSVLSSRETDHLFGIVRSLRDEGIGILFISHKLDEVEAICDDVVVLRDGKSVAHRTTAETSSREVIRLMIGREMSSLYPPRPAAPELNADTEVLRAERLNRKGYFADVSFSVHRGEILGMAGLVGAGRSEVARALFGVDRLDSGTIMIDGRRFVPRSPRKAIKAGLVYLPENRVLNGLVPTMATPMNITMMVWSRFTSRLGLFQARKARAAAVKMAAEVQLQAGRIDQVVTNLSGGNQQKVVLGKVLAIQPRILILDEPTHGIDIGTKHEILRMVTELAAAGVAIILISSELNEVMSVSTRLLVMSRGRIAAELDSTADQSAVMAAAIGAEQYE